MSITAAFKFKGIIKVWDIRRGARARL